MKYKELEKIAMKADYNIIDDPATFNMRNIYKNNDISVSKHRINFIFINNEHCRSEDFEVIKAAMELAETPPDERQEEKRYIIPLPHLTTSNGEQLFLTHQGNFFPHVRDKELRQTWKEKDLIHIPEEYRDFAVEIVEMTEE